MSQSVTPTHRVPIGGLPAWDQADAAGSPVATLDAGLDVQLLSRWGDWAYIRCTNGWSAWVDGRRLQPMAGPAATAQPQYGGHAYGGQAQYGQQSHAAQQYGAAGYAQYGQPTQYQQPAQAFAPRQAAARQAAPGSFQVGGRTLTLTPSVGGAVLAIIGSFLPFLSVEGASSANSWDLPVQFLFDPKTTSSSPDIGLLILVVGVIGGALALLRPDGRETKMAGSALSAICVLYVVSLQRYLSLFDAQGRPGLFSTIGFGVYITFVGALLLSFKIPVGGRR